MKKIQEKKKGEYSKEEGGKEQKKEKWVEEARKGTDLESLEEIHEDSELVALEHQWASEWVTFMLPQKDVERMKNRRAITMPYWGGERTEEIRKRSQGENVGTR